MADNNQRKREATETADGPSSKRQKVDYVQCRRCTARFQNRRELHAHNMEVHFQAGAGQLQPEPWGAHSPPWEKENGDVDVDLRRCYETNRAIILDQHRLGPVLSTYNVPVNPDMTVADLETVLNDIYRTQSHAFKLNISFGVILRHVETEEVRYFRPYSNQALFDQPIFVGRRADIANIVQRLNDTDVIESVIKNRPDTKWRLEFITNARFQVFSTNFVLGTARTPLPSFIKLNDSVIGLDFDHYGLPYNDHLCAFRCLSLYYHKDLKHTSEYFVQWKEYLFSECETDIRELSMKNSRVYSCPNFHILKNVFV